MCTDRQRAAVLTDVEAAPGKTTRVTGEKQLKRRLSAYLNQRVLAARNESPPER